MSQFNWPIIGHQKVINFLQHSIAKKQLTHAYIYYGAKHLGKKTVAKYFAKSIFCGGYHTQQDVPCQQCARCRQFDDKIHPDLVIIKRETDKKSGKLKKNISIDQIRQMRDKLSLSSFLKNYKIAIIEEAEKLSIGAANSLLKILEEPKGKTIFILLSSELESIPQTVVSRCQKIKFLPVSFSEIYDYLVQEKKINRNLALKLAALIQGKPGLADYFLHDENLESYHKNLEENLDLIDQAEYQKIEFISKILPKNTEPEEQKSIVQDFLAKQKMIIRDLLLIKNSPLNTGAKVRLANADFVSNLKKIAENYHSSRLIDLLDKIKKSKIYLNNNVSPKLILENFVLQV